MNFTTNSTSSSYINNEDGKCYCDDTFTIYIVGCNPGGCLFYAIFCCVLFIALLGIVCQQMAVQTLRKGWRSRPNVQIQIFGYCCLILACTLRIVRSFLLVAKSEEYMLLSMLFFFPVMLLYTAYTTYIGLWGFILSKCTLSKKIIFKIMKIFLWVSNFGIYFSIGLGVGIDTDAFLSYWAFLIVGTLTLFVGFSFLKFGNKITEIVLTSPDVTPREERASKIRMVTRTTCMISVSVLVFVCVFLTMAITGSFFLSVDFFIVRHMIYRIFEAAFTVMMLIVLHRKKPTQPKSEMTISLGRVSSSLMFRDSGSMTS